MIVHSYRPRGSRQTTYQRLGSTMDVGIAEARKHARLLRAEIALGKDPRGEEKAKRAAVSFTEFFENDALPYLKQHKRSWARDEVLWRLRIKPRFGHKRLADVTTRDLVEFQAALAEEGLAAASNNHHFRLIRHLYSIAIQWGLTTTNPASRFKMLFEDNKVDHRLDEQQLERFLQVLREDDNKMVSAIVLFLLATGLRTQEALSLTWHNVDLARKQITITVSNSKSKRQRIIPASQVAMEVLNQVGRSESSDYVFTNQQTGTRYVTIYKTFKRIAREAALPALRVHDMRANFASLALNAGVGVYTIKTLLGHANVKTTERYLTASERTLSDATDTLAGIIRRATPPSAPAVVARPVAGAAASEAANAPTAASVAEASQRQPEAGPRAA